MKQNMEFLFRHIYGLWIEVKSRMKTWPKRNVQIYRLESATRMNRSNCYTMIIRDVMFCNDIRSYCAAL